MADRPDDLGPLLAPLRRDLDDHPLPRTDVGDLRRRGAARRRRRNRRRGALAVVAVLAVGAVGGAAFTSGTEEGDLSTDPGGGRPPAAADDPGGDPGGDPASGPTTLPEPPPAPAPGDPLVARLTTTDGTIDVEGGDLATCGDGTGDAPPWCGATRGMGVGREGSDLVVQVGAGADVQVAAMAGSGLLPPDTIRALTGRMLAGEGALAVTAGPEDRAWRAALELAPGSYLMAVGWTTGDGSRATAVGWFGVRPAAAPDQPEPGSSALLAESPQRCTAIPIRPTVLPSGPAGPPTEAVAARSTEPTGPGAAPGARTLTWGGADDPNGATISAGAPVPPNGEVIEVLGRRAVIGMAGDVADRWRVSIAWDQGGACDMSIDLELSGSRAQVDASLAGLREVEPVECGPSDADAVLGEGDAQVPLAGHEIPGTGTALLASGPCPPPASGGGDELTVIVEDSSPP